MSKPQREQASYDGFAEWHVRVDRGGPGCPALPVGFEGAQAVSGST